MPQSVVRFADSPPVLRDFLFYMLTIRGRSVRTVEAYHVDLRTFLRYIKAAGQTVPMDEDTFAGLDITDVGIQQLRAVSLSDVYGFLSYTLFV